MIRMEASKCPKCGDEPHFVEAAEKWYCYGCNSYIDDEEPDKVEAETSAEGPKQDDAEISTEPSSIEEHSKMCKSCGAQLEPLKDGKLYCYVCETYPDDGKDEAAGASEAEPVPESQSAVSDDKTADEARALLDSIPEPGTVEMPIAPILDSKPEPVTIPVSEPEVKKRVDVKMCASCGQPMKWIEKYQRDYCYGCRKYAPKEGSAASKPAVKQGDNGHQHCPSCQGELRYIEKYDEYYCFACKKYPLRKKKASSEGKNPDACPKCGGPLKYIEKYHRKYCFSCKEYAPKGSGQAASEKKVCPTCGSEMKYVQEYNEWYCYDCKKYSLRPSKPVLLF